MDELQKMIEFVDNELERLAKKYFDTMREYNPFGDPKESRYILGQLSVIKDEFDQYYSYKLELTK